MRRTFANATAALLLFSSNAPVQSQTGAGDGYGPPINIAVGQFSSEQECRLYALTSGSVAVGARRSGGVAVGPYGAAAGYSSSVYAAASWRTELVRDCVDNFAGLRQSMESALAASGKFRVVRPGTRGAYLLSGNLSSGGTQTSAVRGSGIDTASLDAGVNIQISLRDPQGRIIFGNLINKRVNVANSVNTGQVDAVSASSDRNVYGQLRTDAAFAVARSVAFDRVPLVVTDISPRRARLNYGAPFLSLGAIIYLTDGDGGSAKCRVATVDGNSVWIEREDRGNFDAFRVGARARFVEADDPAANGRVTDFVDLPN